MGGSTSGGDEVQVPISEQATFPSRTFLPIKLRTVEMKMLAYLPT